MQTVVVGMLAETFLHPGAGSALGVIDLPVARETATFYPFVPGSGLKGALKDWWENGGTKTANTETEAGEAPDLRRLFGQPEEAGTMSVSDARLVLLPVRSLDGPYAWATCPQLLERLRRDLRRGGQSVAALSLSPISPGEVAVSSTGGTDMPMVLEERSFTKVEKNLSDEVGLLAQLVAEPASYRLERQLVVLSDEDFSWFARFGLAVHARNVLDDETKTSKNLWYEEALPPDTVMYALLGFRDNRDLEGFVEHLRKNPYLQIGGNETVGQGWVHMVVLKKQGVKGG